MPILEGQGERGSQLSLSSTAVVIRITVSYQYSVQNNIHLKLDELRFGFNRRSIQYLVQIYISQNIDIK